jgi:hypothetical protein
VAHQSVVTDSQVTTEAASSLQPALVSGFNQEATVFVFFHASGNIERKYLQITNMANGKVHSTRLVAIMSNFFRYITCFHLKSSIFR